MTPKILTELWTHEKRTEAEKSFILNDAVYYEIVHALGVPDHDRGSAALWEAVNFARMGHARGLLDFFERSRSDKAEPKKDDAVAEDFGFDAREINLAPAHRVRFNKDLFHLTFSRCRHVGKAEKKWPKEILGPIHERCLEFVRAVTEGRITQGIKVEVKQWRELLAVLESGRELALTYTEQDVWRVSPGRSLEGGKSRLTDWTPSAWARTQATCGNTAPMPNGGSYYGPNAVPS